MTSEFFTSLLIISGLLLWATVLLLGSAYAVDLVADAFKRTLYEWKIKHRFKKKPIAKCYCIDCFYYKDHCEINKTGRCLRLERIVADDGFCKDAFPYREDDCK